MIGLVEDYLRRADVSERAAAVQVRRVYRMSLTKKRLPISLAREFRRISFVLRLGSQIVFILTPTPRWLTPSVSFRLARYLQFLHTFPDDSVLPFQSRRVVVEASVSRLRHAFA